MKGKGKVLVAMSGGVDSSVAAAYLKEQGYEVVGITMKTWDYTQAVAKSGKEVGCCSLESMNDARSVAIKMDFPHFIVDIRQEFGDWVIDRFVGDYLNGLTPNPCVLCNTHIKWAALLRRADDLECDFIATGHYAQIRHDSTLDRYVVSKGVDEKKDQSYVLWGLPQEHLARSIFPLGEFTKTKIREMASEYGLDEVANKPDSYEICFVPDNNYRGFLKKRVPDLEESVAGGSFVLKDGSKIGEHEGYPFFTIGQRRGLGTTFGEPMYVTEIDAETNTVTLGPKDDLMKHKLVAHSVNMIKYASLEAELTGQGKIRSMDPGAPCLAWQDENSDLHVSFGTLRKAITPGQAVVVYEGDDVVGGGWIRSVEETN